LWSGHPRSLGLPGFRHAGVKHWFGYRKKNPAGNRGTPLNDIVATTWTPAMTTELLELLNVLGRCIELEPRQEDLLDRITTGPRNVPKPRSQDMTRRSGLVCAFRRHSPPIVSWSWRESNPRPQASNQVFSGCSL